MLGFPIVRDSLYNERDSKPRLSLSDFEHHPLLVEALDKMESELEKDKLAGEMKTQHLQDSEQCEQAKLFIFSCTCLVCLLVAVLVLFTIVTSLCQFLRLSKEI